MYTAEPVKSLIMAKQVHDTRVLLPGHRDHDEHLPARPQLRQTRLEVTTEPVQLRFRQKPVIERRLAEPAQQRTPVVVRTEQVIGR
jgi:hypothetical protein